LLEEEITMMIESEKQAAQAIIDELERAGNSCLKSSEKMKGQSK
jgi:hypothetical protein